MGRARATLLGGGPCHPVTMLFFSHCSSSQTRGCRVSDLPTYLPIRGASRGVGVDPLSVVPTPWKSQLSVCTWSGLLWPPSFAGQRDQLVPDCPTICSAPGHCSSGPPAGNSHSSPRSCSRSHLSPSLSPHLDRLVPPLCPWAF